MGGVATAVLGLVAHALTQVVHAVLAARAENQTKARISREKSRVGFSFSLETKKPRARFSFSLEVEKSRAINLMVETSRVGIRFNLEREKSRLGFSFSL